MAAPIWLSFPCNKSEVCLSGTLVSGQCFRWRKTSAEEWTGVFAGRVWTLKQTDSQLFYRVIGRLEHQARPGCMHVTMVTKTETQNETFDDTSKVETNPELCGQVLDHDDSCRHKTESSDQSDCRCPVDRDIKVLRDYLQLHVNLQHLYNTWSDADDHFDKISREFPGIRVLRQDPVECLFSFICSSNNNISRITSMVENLAIHFGEKIAEIDGVTYNAFPRVSALSADGVEEALRQLGFGYRAKYIQRSAALIEASGGDSWLYALRTMEYPQARAQLMKLCGVGAKVADCVCLFSLDQPACIPVDTHVWQIAGRDYLPSLRTAKSLTDRLYQQIGDHFRDLWGPHAGWAHSVLFTADLKQSKDSNKETTAMRTVNASKKASKRPASEKKKGKQKRLC